MFDIIFYIFIQYIPFLFDIVQIYLLPVLESHYSFVYPFLVHIMRGPLRIQLLPVYLLI